MFRPEKNGVRFGQHSNGKVTQQTDMNQRLPFTASSKQLSTEDDTTSDCIEPIQMCTFVSLIVPISVFARRGLILCTLKKMKVNKFSLIHF